MGKTTELVTLLSDGTYRHTTLVYEDDDRLGDVRDHGEVSLDSARELVSSGAIHIARTAPGERFGHHQRLALGHT
ncbi:MAG: hypothetical protein JWP01_3374 [Myxococcales bacterium]|nr:hypothetical protein [Myxococcales bacterium]